MKVTIEIDCDNAAFEPPNAGPELARILRQLSRFVDGYTMFDDWINKTVFDVNGNRVGEMRVSE